MGETSIFWKIRLWIAFKIALPIFYVIFGQKPGFCDLVDEGCPLDKDEFTIYSHEEQLKAYRRAMWAMIIAAGGEIRVSKIILHDANLMGSIETYTDPKTGEYVYSAKP